MDAEGKGPAVSGQLILRRAQDHREAGCFPYGSARRRAGIKPFRRSQN